MNSTEVSNKSPYIFRNEHFLAKCLPELFILQFIFHLLKPLTREGRIETVLTAVARLRWTSTGNTANASHTHDTAAKRARMFETDTHPIPCQEGSRGIGSKTGGLRRVWNPVGSTCGRLSYKNGLARTLLGRHRETSRRLNASRLRRGVDFRYLSAMQQTREI